MAELSLRRGARLARGRPPARAVAQQPVPCAQVKCCGWASFYNWTDNAALMNRTNITFPCSCKRREEDSDTLERRGFCEAPRNATQSGNSPEDWPVYREVGGGLGRGSGMLGSSGLLFQPSSLHLAVPAVGPWVPCHLSIQGARRALSAGPLGWGFCVPGEAT